MDDKELNKIFSSQSEMLAGLIVRVTALENLLISNGLLNQKEYSDKIDGLASDFRKVFEEQLRSTTQDSQSRSSK